MGFFAGHYEGVHQARFEYYGKIQDFARATDLDAYLKQRGQSQEFGRLGLYAVMGPPSDSEIRRTTDNYESIGLVFVVIGLFGLLFTRGRLKKSLGTTAAAHIGCTSEDEAKGGNGANVGT